MRREARALLLADTVVAGLVGNRIFQQGYVPPEAVRPYIVLTRGPQSGDSPYWAFGTPLIAYLIDDQGAVHGFEALDALEKAVIDVLDQRTFTDTDGRFTSYYDGSQGQDMTLDKEQGYNPNAISRAVRFIVYELAWLTTLTYSPDPVVALNTWVADQFPGAVQTDPTTWDPEVLVPGVYWRVRRQIGSRTMNWGGWVDVEVRGHIVSPGDADRLFWVRAISERLVADHHCALTDQSPLEFINVTYDQDAHPMRTGQIVLTAEFGVLASVPIVPALVHATISQQTGAPVTMTISA